MESTVPFKHVGILLGNNDKSRSGLGIPPRLSEGAAALQP